MAAPFVYLPSSVDGNSAEALLKAALDGNLGRIKGIIRNLGIENGDRAAMLSFHKDGFGVLHCAACQGHLEVCKYLVEELGCDPNMAASGGSCEGATPFMASAQSGDISTVKYLLDHGGDLMKADAKGRSCKVTEFLLSKGIPVDIDCGYGTPLYHAANNEQDKTLKILLDHHANPNTIVNGGIGTPLMSSLVYRSLKCMKLLIKAGADVNGEGSVASPLVFATGYGGCTNFIQLLLKAGANPNIPDDLGRLPIELAALRECKEEVEMLLPLTSPIPNVRNWSVDGVISHAKFESTKPLDKMHSDRRRAMIKSQADLVFRKDYALALEFYNMYSKPLSESNSIDWVMAVLKSDPNSVSNCALPQVSQRDMYCSFDSTHESIPLQTQKLTINLEPKSQTMEVPEREHIRKRGSVQDPKITKKSKVNDNTLDSRSKDESQQLMQVRAKPDKSSQEQEFPNTTLLSVLSSNYDDLYESVSAPGKSLNPEAPDKYMHLRKRGQPETSDCSPKISKRTKVHESKTSETNLKDDSRKLTQVFVHFGDTCISLQANLKTTTVRKLISFAMNRKGIRSCDAYLLYCGRVLEEASLLSVFSIPKDASFRVIPRLRAGQDQILITCKTFDVIIKDMKPFYKVLLPVILRKKNVTGDVYMIFLSQAARVLVVQLLIYLSYLHSEGSCFNGKFKITNFLFWNGNAMMHPDVKKVEATGAGCQRDMVKLGAEIEQLFTRNNFFPSDFRNLPGYVSHLVEQLKKFPIHKWDSKVYRLYLSNHQGLLSFNERINKYLGMDLQYDFMDMNMRKIFAAAVGDFGPWEQCRSQVEPLWDTYWHDPKSSKQSRFGSEGVSWMAVGRNFLSHPNEKKRGGSRKSTVSVGFTKEQAEAALAFYWKDNLAKFLLNVIDNFRPQADMDIKLLCGNDLVDPDSRGGKSGGTEVGQLKS